MNPNLLASSTPRKKSSLTILQLTVAPFLSCSLCHLQFPEPLLWVPGRRERHHGRDQGEAHRVSRLCFSPARARRRTGLVAASLIRRVPPPSHNSCCRTTFQTFSVALTWSEQIDWSFSSPPGWAACTGPVVSGERPTPSASCAFASR